MARDSAAVAALDDRRRRCPVSAASDPGVPAPPPDDDASSSMTNGVATSGGSCSSDVGGGGCSPKSSSSASSTGRGCSSSGGGGDGSSRSGSDDDDVSGAPVVVRPSDTSPTPSSHNDPAVAVDKESSSSCGRNDEVPTNDTSTSIGGRLTFYKDGQFIFQLAAHHQHQSYNNQSAATTPCRWVPVPTVIQQHKNNVKKIGEWPQNHQNKTIWPYLVTSPAPESSKSPQPVAQCQPPVAKTGERKQQQYQHRTTTTTPPPPIAPTGSAANVASCTTAVVMATTTNIVRRPSRKCSTTTAADGPNQHWKLPESSQSRPLSKRSQPYQHQSFVMVATGAMKAQRRLLSLANKQYRRRRKTTSAAARESLSLDRQQPPSVNLEYVVRNLWCRRHTTELLMRRQLSLNKCGGGGAGAGAGVDTVDSPTPATRHSSADSACPTAGNGKRRSAFFPPPATDVTVPGAASMTTDGVQGMTGGGGGGSSNSSSSSPSKKCRLGGGQQHHQRAPPPVMDHHKSARKTVASSNNDHSITAILSGGAAGAKRGVDSGNCHITSTTCGGNVVTPHQPKIPPLSSAAPLSLLRTLLKSPGGEIGPSPVTAAAACVNGGYNSKHHQSGGRKRSAAVESPPAAAMASAAPVGAVNDAAAAALNALHQLPAALHHPSTVAAAAGYFNVLYHQAAMAAAAMAYQTHSQMPKSPQQPGPLLPQQLPQHFQAAAATAGNSWKRQPNRRPPPHPTAVESVAGVASTVVAPYSSPLAAVNGVLLPPATPSPPPLPLHSQPVHSPYHHHRRRHLQYPQPQQYQPVQVPAVQPKPPSPYHQQPYHSNKRRQQGSGVKLQGTSVAEYGDRVDGNSAGAAVVVESSPSADCVPLNLSKDSVAENIGDTTATVR